METKEFAAAAAMPVTLSVNGESYTEVAEARTLLVFFLRDRLLLKGTNHGCDTGNCGACTVIWNGKLVKSCMVLAVQTNGGEILTVEGLAPIDGGLHPVQQAFKEHHGLQCGYCTPGMLLSAKYLLDRNPSPGEEQIRRGLKGNLCRCTGYENIVTAVQSLSQSGDRQGVDAGLSAPKIGR